MKTLIIYATKYGCTEKAAKILASKIHGEVNLVNIMKESSPALSEFDTVLLGGSIYIGKIQKQLSSFISNNLKTLLTKKIGLFICAGLPDEEVRIKELKDSFPAELYNHASCREIFGSEIYYEKLGFLEKFMMKKIKGTAQSEFNLSEDKISLMAANMQL